MTRNNLFVLSGVLALAGVVCLWLGVSMMRGNVRTHVAEQYQQYTSDGNGANYACEGTPSAVADEIADFEEPEVRVAERNTTYLRYEDDIVIVGPDGDRSCTIRVEDLGARYNQGAFIYLGPGFHPGSPSGSSGGSPGGPDGSK